MSTSTEGEPNQGAPVDGEEEAGKSTVLTTIRALQSGSTTGKHLSKDDRQACVEHLTNEGYSLPEIADIFKMSERTIARDRKAIQEAHALEHDPKLAPIMVGRLICEMEICIQRIRRAARDKDALPADRIQSEFGVFKIIHDAIQLLQRLGYLPTAAQKLEASLKHDFDALPPLTDLLQEVKRLEIVAEQNQDGELVKKLTDLKKLTGHAHLAVEVAELTQPSQPMEPEREDLS